MEPFASYWSDKSRPVLEADIAIVGGGYVGLSVAYWLTEINPGLKIIVLERSYCGAGASGRNAGFLTVGSASFYKSVNSQWGRELSLKLNQFGQESLNLVFEKILKPSAGVSYESSSSMTLLHSLEHYKSILSEDFDPLGFNFSFRENHQLAGLLREKFFGSLESGIEYKINPMHLINVLKNCNESRRVRILEKEAVFNMTAEGLESSKYRIKANKIVLALDGYFSQFHSTFHGKIIPRRAQMLAVGLPEEFDCPHLYYDSPERVYWRTVDRRTLLIGGKRLLDAEAEVGEFEKISLKIQTGLENYLKEQLGLKEYKILQRWSGTMGFTEHELPFSEAVTAPIETYILGGFSGHGMGFGFGAAKDLAEVVSGEKRPTFFGQFKREQFII